MLEESVVTKESDGLRSDLQHDTEVLSTKSTYKNIVFADRNSINNIKEQVLHPPTCALFLKVMLGLFDQTLRSTSRQTERLLKWIYLNFGKCRSSRRPFHAQISSVRIAALIRARNDLRAYAFPPASLNQRQGTKAHRTGAKH